MAVDINQISAKDIMTPDVFMAYEGWSVKRLSSFFIKNGISGAPVIASDHSLVGVVSATDIINFEGKTDKEKSELMEEVYSEFVGMHYDEVTINELAAKADERITVNKVMTPKVVKIDENSKLTDVADKMLEEGIRRIFVTKDGLMAGVISTTNLLQAIGSTK